MSIPRVDVIERGGAFWVFVGGVPAAVANTRAPAEAEAERWRARLVSEPEARPGPLIALRDDDSE